MKKLYSSVLVIFIHFALEGQTLVGKSDWIKSKDFPVKIYSKPKRYLEHSISSDFLFYDKILSFDYEANFTKYGYSTFFSFDVKTGLGLVLEPNQTEGDTYSGYSIKLAIFLRKGTRQHQFGIGSTIYYIPGKQTLDVGNGVEYILPGGDLLIIFNFGYRYKFKALPISLSLTLNNIYSLEYEEYFLSPCFGISYSFSSN